MPDLQKRNQQQLTHLKINCYKHLNIEIKKKYQIHSNQKWGKSPHLEKEIKSDSVMTDFNLPVNYQTFQNLSEFVFNYPFSPYRESNLLQNHLFRSAKIFRIHGWGNSPQCREIPHFILR